jgi:hypothetical protein
VAAEITANRSPVQHCGNPTFREGDLPAVAIRKPAKNAGAHLLCIMVMCELA